MLLQASQKFANGFLTDRSKMGMVYTVVLIRVQIISNQKYQTKRRHADLSQNDLGRGSIQACDTNQ